MAIMEAPPPLIRIVLCQAVKKFNSSYNNGMNIRKIVKGVIPKGLFERVEPIGHLTEAVMANIRYGFPARKLKIIGVTGTNGKTTTCYYIYKMLQESGIDVALSTTVAYGVGDDITVQYEHVTTASAMVLQRRLRQFVAAGAEWAVIETSSHGLAQHRVWGIPYEIAVMTNVTHDHLDYHKTFERYRDAKRRLFKIANHHGRRFGVVNADDPSADLFVSDVKNSTTYGLNAGDVRATDVKLFSSGSQYKVTISSEEYNIKTHLPGEFNVSNSLAAAVVGQKLGLSKTQIENGIEALQGVEGRMNRIDEGQPFQVIVDFASTPDGFEKLFSSIRPLVKGKLVAVFGSAGRRDESKRAEQGAIAAKYADYLVVTEEDNRDEDGAKILAQIAAGAATNGKTEANGLTLIANREEAIGYALSLVTGADDAVVLLGKGHEKTIERADGEYAWNEAEIVRTALRALRRSGN